MYLGRIVEQGTVEAVLHSPQHPYTQALLSAVPSPQCREKPEIIRLVGETPSPANPPAGCHFHPRCGDATALCRTSYPPLRPLSATQAVACHRLERGD